MLAGELDTGTKGNFFKRWVCDVTAVRLGSVDTLHQEGDIGGI